ncbi:MAG: hypothetical protein J6Y64_00840 [Ruminococcus sp.]|nr:hypothetical protein [Ruminococcus sp.]
MTGICKRSFSPNIFHIISAALFIAAFVLIINGAFRALRVTNARDQSYFASESDIRKNKGITFNVQPVKARLKGGTNDIDLCCGQLSEGVMDANELYVIKTGEKYRYLSVIRESEEYMSLFAGKKVTGYFSDKHSDIFTDFISNMDGYYEPDTIISPSDCSKLGIVEVDTEKEMWSFLRGLPLLAAGLLLLLKAGSPFFDMPEDTPYI